jgi:hypothetical protein
VIEAVRIPPFVLVPEQVERVGSFGIGFVVPLRVVVMVVVVVWIGLEVGEQRLRNRVDRGLELL